MYKTNQIIATAFWVIGILMLCAKSEPFFGALFFIPFSLGPQVITHIGISCAKSAKAQIILLVALLAYFAWFVLVYIAVFYILSDPQSPIVLVFVGIYAAPVMLLLWGAALWSEMKARRQQHGRADG